MSGRPVGRATFLTEVVRTLSDFWTDRPISSQSRSSDAAWARGSGTQSHLGRSTYGPDGYESGRPVVRAANVRSSRTRPLARAREPAPALPQRLPAAVRYPEQEPGTAALNQASSSQLRPTQGLAVRVGEGARERQRPEGGLCDRLELLSRLASAGHDLQSPRHRPQEACHNICIG